MSEQVTTRIGDAATRLHLANLGENLEALVAQAETSTMGYLELLDLVLEEETGIREGKRFRNALKLSGLPHHKTLDEFDFAFQPELDARKVKDLATLGFVEAKTTWPSSVRRGGQDHAGRRLGHRRLPGRVLIYFTTLRDMLRQLPEAESTGRFARSCRPTSSPRCSCSTRSVTCPCPGPRPTWCSISSAAATSAAA